MSVTVSYFKVEIKDVRDESNFVSDTSPTGYYLKYYQTYVPINGLNSMTKQVKMFLGGLIGKCTLSLVDDLIECMFFSLK